MKIAILDDERALIDYKEVSEASSSEIVVPDDCDLPTDGTYKWDGVSFIPLGYGFAKPRRPPIDTEYALYLVIKTLFSDMPKECRDWASWYKDELAQRAEEMAMRRKKGK